MIQRAIVAAAVELALVGPDKVGSRIQGPEALKKIPLYDHVVAGEVRAAQTLGSATLVTGARNGVVHVIDTALIPR